MTFETNYGHHRFLVMSFGLTNALATFMSLMNFVVKPFMVSFFIVSIDDILVYSKSKKDNTDHPFIILVSLGDKTYMLNYPSVNSSDSCCLFGACGFKGKSYGIFPKDQSTQKFGSS